MVNLFAQFIEFLWYKENSIALYLGQTSKQAD